MQSRPRTVPSVAQHPVQTARRAPSACCDPHHPKTLPCTFLCHWHQVKCGSQQRLEATQGSCHVTGDHPPGYHWQTKEFQEDTKSVPPHQKPTHQSFNTGTYTWPQIQLGITVHFENGGYLALWLLGDSEEDWVGYVELEGPGAEPNNAILGQAEPHDHQAPQPAPSVRAPCSIATATLTEPATHLAISSSSQSGSNYQGSPYKLYCTLEASGLSNSDHSTVYCLIKMTHT